VAEEAEVIRTVERTRLRALVEADLNVMEHLHADDFELINPDGEVYSREQYLFEVGSGLLDYTAWDADEISVRMYSDVAVIRYHDQRFEVQYDGEVVGTGRLHHTNLYEKRTGSWRIVWSHATGAS
jgi:hypothetical protein